MRKLTRQIKESRRNGPGLSRRKLLVWAGIAALHELLQEVSDVSSVRIVRSPEAIRSPRTAGSANGDLLSIAKKACRLRHDERNAVGAEALFEEVEKNARTLGDWKAENRARLNRAYIRMEWGDFPITKELAEAARGAALAQNDFKLAAEAEICLGRRAQHLECHAETQACCRRAIELTDRLPADERSTSSGPLDNVLATVGHSLIVPHDLSVPSAWLRASARHFSGKSGVLRAWGGDKTISSYAAVTDLEVSRRIDKSLGAEPNLGFDLLWILRAWRTAEDRSKRSMEQYLGFEDSASSSKIGETLLGECNDCFGWTGTGRGDWFIEQAHQLAPDKPQRAMENLELAMYTFIAVPLPRGLADAYIEIAEFNAQYQWRPSTSAGSRRALRAAFAAAALRPYGAYLTFLGRAAEAGREFEGRNYDSFVRKMRKDLSEFRDEFEPLKMLINKLDPIGRGALKQGCDIATAIATHPD